MRSSASAEKSNTAAGSLCYPERVEKRLHRAGVQAHDGYVERSLARPVDRAHPLLLLNGRLLQIDGHCVALSDAKHSVPAGLFRCCIATEGDQAGLGETDLAGIEADQRIAGRHEHLPASGGAGRKSQEVGHQTIEQGHRQGRAGIGGQRNEDLAARSVGGKTAGVAAGMYDQDAKLAQDGGNSPRPLRAGGARSR